MGPFRRKQGFSRATVSCTSGKSGEPNITLKLGTSRITAGLSCGVWGGYRAYKAGFQRAQYSLRTLEGMSQRPLRLENELKPFVCESQALNQG